MAESNQKLAEWYLKYKSGKSWHKAKNIDTIRQLMGDSKLAEWQLKAKLSLRRSNKASLCKYVDFKENNQHICVFLSGHYL